jgi:hypothetical protein
MAFLLLLELDLFDKLRSEESRASHVAIAHVLRRQNRGQRFRQRSGPVAAEVKSAAFAS